jgi:preprotein translocase subunit SecY
MVAAGFQNIFKIPELKRRVLYTLGLLAVYRIGVHVPTPGIDAWRWPLSSNRPRGRLLGLFDMFSGGALERLSVFALGIMPYISASIILQLLTVVVPHLERLSKEGRAGAEEDHPVHPLRHGGALHDPGLRHQRGARKHDRPGGAGGDRSGVGLPA